MIRIVALRRSLYVRYGIRHQQSNIICMSGNVHTTQIPLIVLHNIITSHAICKSVCSLSTTSFYNNGDLNESPSLPPPEQVTSCAKHKDDAASTLLALSCDDMDDRLDVVVESEMYEGEINMEAEAVFPSIKLTSEKNIPSTHSETQVWKSWTEQVIGSTSTIQRRQQNQPDVTMSHLVLLIQWWTRQRPFTDEAAIKTWKLFDLVETIYVNESISHSNNEVVAKSNKDFQNLVNIVLDHWRLSGKAPSVSVPYTAYEVWQRLQDLSTSSNMKDILNIRTYAILVSAISRQNFDTLPPHRKGPLSPLALAVEVLQHYMEHRPKIGNDAKRDKISQLILWNSILTVIAKQGHGPHVGEKAEMMFRVMQNDMQSTQISPDTISYACLLEAWVVAAKHNRDAGGNAERLLQEMITVCGDVQVSPMSGTHIEGMAEGIRKPILTEAEELNRIAVSNNKAMSICYLHVLRAYCDSDTPNGADKANDILQKLRNAYITSLSTSGKDKEGSEKISGLSTSLRTQIVSPTRHFFSAVMAGYADRGKPAEAERLLFELQSLYDSSGGDMMLFPTTATFNSVLEAYARQGTQSSAERAQLLLEQLHAKAVQSDTSSNTSSYGESKYKVCRPDTTSVNTCIHAWAQSGAPDAVERAEGLLLKASQWPSISPDPYTYTSVMKALANSSRPDAAERCESILQHMWDQYKRQGPKSSCKPNDVTYSTAIYCWSTCKDNLDAPLRAESLYKDMRERYENGDHSLKPTLQVYITLILAWAQSARKEGDVRAQLYFDLLRGQYLAGDDSLRPNDKVYRALIESKKVRNDGEGAEMTLNHMYDDYLTHGNTGAMPNRYIFHGVMSAWVNSKNPNAYQRIEAIVHRMQQEYKVRKWDCKPNAITYTILLNCLSKIGTKDSAVRAEKVLRHMHELSSTDESVKPCRYSCTAVMQAWANTVNVYEAPLRAQAIFDDMIRLSEPPRGNADIRPNSFTYNSLLTTWARSLHADAGDRSFSILQEMERCHQVDPKNFDAPNHFHYTAVISAFANIGNVDHVESLLKMMVDRRIKPHSGTLNSVLKAYSRSSSPDAVDRAEKLLRTMQYQYNVTPNHVSYTTFILCIQRRRRPDSYSLAKSVVKEMIHLTLNKYANGISPVVPNIATFAILLVALRECTDSSIDKIIELNDISSLMEMMGVVADVNSTIQKDMIKIRLLSSSSSKSSSVSQQVTTTHHE